MIRLFAAALLALAAVSPALACHYNRPVQASRGTVVASQPATGHTAPARPASPKQG